MVVTVVLETDELAIIHDIIYDLTDHKATDTQCQSSFDLLPEDLIGNAVAYGLSDTPTRESIYEYMEEQYKLSLKED